MKGIDPAALSLAEKVGFGSLLLAGGLLCVDPGIALLPLTAFLTLCLLAPFFPRFGFFLPITSKGRPGREAIALTFDDGPSPDSTPQLLHLLARHGFRATFFVTGDRAARHPQLLKDILADGHTIGNHSYSHDSLLMIRSSRRLYREIARAQEVLRGEGIRTFVFRPPVGITNPRLKAVMRELGLTVVNFSCRIFDGGNKRIQGLSARILSRLKPGDLVVLHDTRPTDTELARCWLQELDLLFQGLKAREMKVLPLEEMIGFPVMRAAEGVTGFSASKSAGRGVDEFS